MFIYLASCSHVALLPLDTHVSCQRPAVCGANTKYWNKLCRYIKVIYTEVCIKAGTLRESPVVLYRFILTRLFIGQEGCGVKLLLPDVESTFCWDPSCLITIWQHLSTSYHHHIIRACWDILNQTRQNKTPDRWNLSETALFNSDWTQKILLAAATRRRLCRDKHSYSHKEHLKFLFVKSELQKKLWLHGSEWEKLLSTNTKSVLTQQDSVSFCFYCQSEERLPQ